ncbi:MAG: hypothetical protein ABSE46_13275 [Terracidiphilus sp.]|jgi:hypothetical protein
MKQMTSSELHEAVHQALEEVSRRLESGELDGSGRYYTDEELAAGTAMGIEAVVRAPRKRIA